MTQSNRPAGDDSYRLTDLSDEQVGQDLQCDIDLKIDIQKGTFEVTATNAAAIAAMVAFGLLVLLVALGVYGANLLFASYALPAQIALPLDAVIAAGILCLGWKAVKDWRSRR